MGRIAASTELIIVADRHVLDSELISRRLGDMWLVESCRPGEILQRDVRRVDLVLLAAESPTAVITDAARSARAVVLLHDGSVAPGLQANTGVRAAIDRATPATELRQIVRDVLNGHVQVPDPATSVPRRDLLSPRQGEVLRLLARGLANKDIAHELDISPHTVRTHVQALLSKLERSDRVGAVGAARTAGLLER